MTREAWDVAYNYVTFVVQNDDYTTNFFEQLAKVGVTIVGQNSAEYS